MLIPGRSRGGTGFPYQVRFFSLAPTLPMHPHWTKTCTHHHGDTLSNWLLLQVPDRGHANAQLFDCSKLSFRPRWKQGHSGSYYKLKP